MPFAGAGRHVTIIDVELPPGWWVALEGEETTLRELAMHFATPPLSVIEQSDGFLLGSSDANELTTIDEVRACGAELLATAYDAAELELGGSRPPDVAAVARVAESGRVTRLIPASARSVCRRRRTDAHRGLGDDVDDDPLQAHDQQPRSHRSRGAPRAPLVNIRAVGDDGALTVPGLYLNSFGLAIRGDARMFRMEGAATGRTRDEIRDLSGVGVWIEGEDAFSYRQPGALEAAKVIDPLHPIDGLSLWTVREAIVEHSRSLGFDAWFGRAGELHMIGAIPSATEDRFRIEHGVLMRVTREEFIDADAVLTVRHRAAWRYAGALTDTDVAARAVGQSAVRLRGDGPRRGRVARVAGACAILQLSAGEVEVGSEDYTLAVNSRFVASWRGSAVLRRLRVTTGELTVSGQRNRHGVEDRFRLAGDVVRKLGSTIPVAGGGEIEIGPPVAVRLEDRP